MLPFLGAGADWFARVWQTDDGLLDNVVSGLAQTPDGFLWIGTQGGLMRFDGAQFQEFSPSELTDAPSRGVEAMTLDRSGRLWVALNQAVLACLSHDNVRLFTAKDGLPDIRVSTMTEDAQGDLWIAYFTGGFVSRIHQGHVQRFRFADRVPSYGTSWLACDTEGRLWFTKGDQVGLFTNGLFSTLLTLDKPASRIAAARAGGVWINTSTRLFKLKAGGNLEEKAKLPQPSAAPDVLFEDAGGVLWIGTETAYGLFRYDGQCFEVIHTSHSAINCLMEDKERNLWVGTGGGGLNRLRPRILELLNTGIDRPFESVRSLCEDAKGGLWFVTRDGLLMRQQGTNWEDVLSSANWPGGRASCVAAARNGAVWIGTRGNGLFRFQNNQFTVWRRGEGLDSDYSRSLLASSDGGVWIGMDSPRELQRLHDGKFTSFQMPPGARTIRAMAEDAKTNIWAATAEGQLLRVSGNQLINQTVQGPSSLLSIRCLHATPDGSLWIGYVGGGLGRLKDGRYSRITRAQGLEDDFISQLVSDDEGWLWLAGSHGFFRAPLQQLNDAAEGRISHVHSIVFGRGEGLPSLQANYDNYPTAARGRDGCLRIGTRTGLAVIHPENIRDNPQPPPVVIERLAVDGHTVALYETASPMRGREVAVANLKTASGRAAAQVQPLLRLAPSHRKLEFEFTALSFSAPENVRFRYRLEGLDEDWNESGTTRGASYSRLSPADYRFRVIACNNSGVWNETGACLSFTVLPFFWQTWPFQAAVIAGFSLSLIGIVRYVSFRRLRQQLLTVEQQATLDKERARIARDLHDDLGGSLTQVSLLLEMPPDKSTAPDQHIRHCASLVRTVVQSVDGIIWAINPQNDTLPYLIDYLSQYAVEFLQAAEIHCRVDLPDETPERHVSPELRHNLFLVVKEALNNIARHAHATEVWLRVTAGDQQLGISIEDNGQGFDKTVGNPHSNGLRNMRQRMEEIGGCFILETKPGAGARLAFIYLWPRPA